MNERTRTEAKANFAEKENSFSNVRESESLKHIQSPAELINFLHKTYGNQMVERLLKSGVLQAKPKISQPNDVYEREADRVAEQVMRMPEPTIQRLPIRVTPLVKHQVAKEDNLQAKDIEGQSPEGQSPATTPSIESRISELQGGGQPLNSATRAFFEPRFGQDFSRVRIHTDSKAAEVARAVNANAFTVGHNIVFGAGQYSPKINNGQRLLAHELTHVIQQDNFLGAFKEVVQRQNLSSAPTQKQYKIPEESSAEVVVEPLYQINHQNVIDAEDFKGRCSEAIIKMEREYDSVLLKILELVLPFSKAFKNFNDTLKEAFKSKQEIENLYWGSVFAFISGGIGGYLGKLMNGQSPILTEATKDLVKDSIRRYGREAITDDPSKSEKVYEPDSSDETIIWRSLAERDILAAKEKIKAYIEYWLNSVNTRRSSFKLDFDPVIEVQTLLNNQPELKEIKKSIIPKNIASLLFEKGMWKGWIENNRYHLQKLEGTWVTAWQIGDRVPPGIDALGGLPAYSAGRYIRNRISLLASGLGENSDTWLQQWGVESHKKLMAERDKLNEGTLGDRIKDALK